MPIARLDQQQVLGALKATASSDPDVLYARKEELLSESRKMKLLGIAPILVGIAMSITIIGAVVGIPAIIFGVVMRRRIRNNVNVADSTYADYIRNLNSAPRSAVA